MERPCDRRPDECGLILEWMKRTEEKMDRILCGLQSLSGAWPIMAEEVKALRREIWGNGTTGLKTRVYMIAVIAAVLAAGVGQVAQAILRLL